MCWLSVGPVVVLVEVGGWSVMMAIVGTSGLVVVAYLDVKYLDVSTWTYLVAVLNDSCEILDGWSETLWRMEP